MSNTAPAFAWALPKAASQPKPKIGSKAPRNPLLKRTPVEDGSTVQKQGVDQTYSNLRKPFVRQDGRQNQTGSESSYLAAIYGTNGGMRHRKPSMASVNRHSPIVKKPLPTSSSVNEGVSRMPKSSVSEPTCRVILVTLPIGYRSWLEGSSLNRSHGKMVANRLVSKGTSIILKCL